MSLKTVHSQFRRKQNRREVSRLNLSCLILSDFDFDFQMGRRASDGRSMRKEAVSLMNPSLMTPTTDKSNDTDEPTLFLIGIDDHLAALLVSMKIRVETFDSVEHFLSTATPDQPGCIVCEVRVGTGISGFDLLGRLRDRTSDLPVILVSAAADMSMALRCVAEGAVTLLSTSSDVQLVWEAVHKGLQLNRNLRISGTIRREVVAMISSLTDREEQVLRLVTEGHANKQIAAELGVSLRSVEKWRKEGLEKLNIESPLQLLTILMRAGFQEWPGRLS